MAAPASDDEIADAWGDRELPADLVALWRTTREARLFEDQDYGQWGIVLLDPAASARRTARERADRPEDLQPDDIVIGEFLGDADLVVLEPKPDGGARVLIDLPLDPRADWPLAADDLGEFLATYFENNGEMFWDPARGA